MRHLLVFSIIYLLLIIAIPFSFAQEPSEPLVGAPKTLADFPEALKNSWQEALAIWGEALDWFKNLWSSYIFPFFEGIWQRIYLLLGKEVERRKPEVKEEFEKEKKEMKEEIKVEVPKIGESIWQKFKELIK